MTKKLTHNTEVSTPLQQITGEFPAQIVEVEFADSCSPTGVAPCGFDTADTLPDFIAKDKRCWRKCDTFWISAPHFQLCP